MEVPNRAVGIGTLRQLLAAMKVSPIWQQIVEPRDQVYARFQPLFALKHLPQLTEEAPLPGLRQRKSARVR